MTRKGIAGILVTIVLLMGVPVIWALTSNLQNDEITRERLRLYPVTEDFRSYFFLQSIGDSTSIVLSDFTGSEPVITLVQDNQSDNVIDQVVDYFTQSKAFRVPLGNKSKNQHFNPDIQKMKQDIIEGKIFRNNYSYKMKGLDFLYFSLKHSEGSNVVKSEDGYTVTYLDPDTKAPMAQFYFAKKLGRYDLVFKTNFYTLFNARITPPLEYSVYCRGSKDPVVAATVEELLKVVRQ